MFHLLSKVAPYLHFLYGSLFALLTVVFGNLLPPTTTGGLLVAVSSSEVHWVHPNSKTIGTSIRGQHYAGAAVALTAIWLITVLGGSTCALRSAYTPSFSLPHIFLHRPVVTYQGKVRTLTALHILVCAQMHALHMTCNNLWCRGNQGQFCFKGVVRVIHACTELAIHFSRRRLALKVCESSEMPGEEERKSILPHIFVYSPR